MNVPTRSAQAQIEVKKSRFLAIAEPVCGPGQVRTVVQEIRARYPDASHVVHAALWGAGADQFSMSDDHEPKNTAGRPVLEVLKGSGTTNVAICIVRWFGGTLLGTGGLVKAYTDAAKAVVSILETEELVDKSPFSLEISYGLYEQAKHLLAASHAQWSEDFGTTITIAGTMDASLLVQFATDISNLSSGSCQVRMS